jgi:cytidylate kinase
MSAPRTVAVDGPSGVGKSTIGRLVADRYGYLFFDTGALYRAVSHAALRRGVEPGDGEALARLAGTLRIELERAAAGSGRMYHVRVEGEDVTEELRSAAVERVVSEVSAHPEVRAALLGRQREIARASRSVLVGRDIGTVVLPDADLKVYLDAPLEERARRRHRELLDKDGELSLESVAQELRRRDRIDSERASAPLRIPPDAVVVDTAGKGIEQVLAEIEPWIVP